MPDGESSGEPWLQPGWLTPEEFAASEGVQDWRFLGDSLYAFFRAESFRVGGELVRAITQLRATASGRAPDIDLRPDGVTVRLTTITTDLFFCGLATADVDTARQISAAARATCKRADVERTADLAR